MVKLIERYPLKLRLEYLYLIEAIWLSLLVESDIEK